MISDGDGGWGEAEGTRLNEIFEGAVLAIRGVGHGGASRRA